MVLCQCHGKAVRHNQWRVCRLFLQVIAPEDHLHATGLPSRRAIGRHRIAIRSPPDQRLI